MLMKLHMNVPWVTLFQSYTNGSGPLHIGATKGKNREILEQTLKIFLSKTRRPRALIFDMQYHLMALYQDCSNYSDPLINMATMGRGPFSLYGYIVDFKNLLVRNHKA